MKISEFRKLIREEVRKVINEVQTAMPSDGIVKDDKGRGQIKFTSKGSGTEVKSLSTGKTITSPLSIEKAYNALFKVGQIEGNDGSSFNGKKHIRFNNDFADLDPNDWKRFLIPSVGLRVGTKGEDINMYPLTVVAGPFNSIQAITSEIKSKYPKAMDIMQNTDLIDELKSTSAVDVSGFYLVRGPDYDGSGFTIVNGEDIVPN